MKHNFMNKANGKIASVVAIYLDDVGHMQTDSYDKVEDLMEDYAAYKRNEPYIENEKAREIVRAWTECCHAQVVHHYLCDGNSCFIFTDEGGNDCSLDFTFRIDNLESNADYTVAELCKKEE